MRRWRRRLIRALGGFVVFREPQYVDVTPAALIASLRLIDGLLSSGHASEAQGVLRAAIIHYQADTAAYFSAQKYRAAAPPQS